MQKPLARSRIAWWRPPVMLTACRLSPVQTCRNASTLAPTMWAAAWCMPRNAGLSSVPSPNSSSRTPGMVPARVTASIRRGSWTVAIPSASAIGPGTTRRPWSSTPSSSASRIVRSTRNGDIGWAGPKSYSVSDRSKTTVAGPEQSGMPGTVPLRCEHADASHVPCHVLVARLRADHLETRTHVTTGRPRAAVLQRRGDLPGALTPGAPMTRTLSLLTPSGRLTLGSYLGALRPMARLAARAGEDAFYGISDLHAMTTAHDPRLLRRHA